LALLAVATVWGATFPLAKRILEHLSPFQYLGLRFVFAAAVLAVVAAPELRRAGPRVWRGGLAAGLALAAGYALQTLGLREAAATVAAFLTGLSVVLVPVLALAASRRPAGAEWAGVVLGLAGLALLTWHGGFAPRGPEILLVGCALAFATHILLVDRFARESPPAALGAIQLAVVGLACGALSLGDPAPRAVPTGIWVAVAAMGLLASAAAFTLQSWAQRFTTPAHVGLMFAFEPVAAALFARWWLQEQLAVSQWIGAVLVLAGIAVAEARPARQPSR
jgi:drug/metabolite transporter (DMT)-like permease